VLDKERIMSKVAELDSFLGELKQVSPATFDQYQAVEKKRSCERLLQLCIECIIDVCKMLVSGLKLGLPSDENDLFNKLRAKRIISKQMAKTLREMRGFRNILIHEYAAVDDELVYSYVKTNIKDFEEFKTQIFAAISS
jgi:uncharacterized protein YutE (UPF0331/DUF86 family)